MFQGLFKRAERSIDSVVGKFVDRALVAAPLLVAAGFATAALTVKLVQLYGHVTAYALMAALFAVIGVVTMAVVGVGNNTNASSQSATSEPEEAADASASGEETSDMDVTDLLTPEVRAILASAAPMALPGIARGVGKNLPLILFLALIGFVISRFAGGPGEGTGEPDQTAADAPSPDPAAAEATSASAAAAAA
jgi:hypothetical protein